MASSMPADMSRRLNNNNHPLITDTADSYVQVQTAIRRIESAKVDEFQEIKSLINIMFFCKQILVDDDYLVSGNDDYPVTISRWELTIGVNELEHLPNEQERLKDALHLNLRLDDDDDADWISRCLLQSAIESPGWSTALSAGHNFVLIAVELNVERYVMRPSASQQLPMEGDVPSGMVPATEESIKTLLVRRKVQDSDSELMECMICLEQLCQDNEAVSMPCSHLFHGDCIQGWLHTSHCCPICRFQMPKACS